MRNGDRHNVSQGAVMDIKGEHFHGKEHKRGEEKRGGYPIAVWHIAG